VGDTVVVVVDMAAAAVVDIVVVHEMEATLAEENNLVDGVVVLVCSGS
jgi:hypothetical protein